MTREPDVDQRLPLQVMPIISSCSIRPVNHADGPEPVRSQSYGSARWARGGSVATVAWTILASLHQELAVLQVREFRKPLIDIRLLDGHDRYTIVVLVISELACGIGEMRCVESQAA